MAAPRTRHEVVGTLALVQSALVLVTVWRLLPARVASVDASFTLIGVLLALGGLGVAVGARWGRPLAILALGTTLLLGMATVLVLAFASGEVAGLYAPVGEGIAILLVLALLLVAPYLVALPAAQLYFLVSKRRAGSDATP